MSRIYFLNILLTTGLTMLILLFVELWQVMSAFLNEFS